MAAADGNTFAAMLVALADLTRLEDAISSAAAMGELRALVKPAAALTFERDLATVTGLAMRDPLRPYLGYLVELKLDILSGHCGNLNPWEDPPKHVELQAIRDKLGARQGPETDRVLWIVTPPGAAEAPDPARVAPLLRASGVMGPVEVLCAELCPATADACLTAHALAVTRSIGPAFQPLLSPLEAVVPTAEYQASPRFRGDILAAAASGPDALAAAREVDACLADAALGAHR